MLFFFLGLVIKMGKIISNSCIMRAGVLMFGDVKAVLVHTKQKTKKDKQKLDRSTSVLRYKEDEL